MTVFFSFLLHLLLISAQNCSSERRTMGERLDSILALVEGEDVVPQAETLTTDYGMVNKGHFCHFQYV